MERKQKVIVLYRSPKTLSNDKLVLFIGNCLREVFGEYVLFEDCFMADLLPGEKLEADAFLAIDERVFERAKEFVKDFDKVIKIERSLTLQGLKQISEIPSGTNVLVVNDSYATALSAVYLLYESGITHINMIPFDRKKAHTGIYDNLTSALTLGERHFVPNWIKYVTDIGNRHISFNTMFKLLKMLELENELINRNLLKYVQPLAESNNVFRADYIDGFLRDEMLRELADTNQNGIILVDRYNQILYANRKAEKILGTKDFDLKEIFGDENWEKQAFYSHTVCINGNYYDCGTHLIRLMEDIVGCYITLIAEVELEPMKKENRQKGYVVRHSFGDIIHISEKMKKVVHTAEQVAMSEHTVILYGESGTGKELFAQSIHNASERKNGPFVAVNCASLPENLLESELFGYEAGAFTGANSRGKSGLFEQANNGSIFLDEIGEISPSLQTKLLRVIQERQVMRIGSDRIVDVNVRLIAATNKKLEAAVKDGSFRSDLFYRLNVLPVYIPPIRERSEDIEPLLHHFLGNRFGNLTQAEMQVLETYEWQGNVRELQNFCTYYETLGEFPEYLRRKEGKQVKKQNLFSKEDVRNTILQRILENTEAAHGIGREALLKDLRTAGVNLSDRSLRENLKPLQEEGLITIGKGRGGMRISEKGIALLSNKEVIAD